MIGKVGGEPVGEKAPDHQDGFAIVMQVARVLGDVQVVHEPGPVVGQLAEKGVGGLPAHVVGDGKGAPRAVSSVSRVVQHVGWMARNANDKPLHEDSVDAVIQHPIEMPIHRLLVLRTEQIRLAAIRIRETGGGILVGIFAHLRPHLESESVGRDSA